MLEASIFSPYFIPRSRHFARSLFPRLVGAADRPPAFSPRVSALHSGYPSCPPFSLLGRFSPFAALSSVSSLPSGSSAALSVAIGLPPVGPLARLRPVYAVLRFVLAFRFLVASFAPCRSCGFISSPFGRALAPVCSLFSCACCALRWRFMVCGPPWYRLPSVSRVRRCFVFTAAFALVNFLSLRLPCFFSCFLFVWPAPTVVRSRRLAYPAPWRYSSPGLSLPLPDFPRPACLFFPVVFPPPCCPSAGVYRLFLLGFGCFFCWGCFCRLVSAGAVRRSPSLLFFFCSCFLFFPSPLCCGLI